MPQQHQNPSHVLATTARRQPASAEMTHKYGSCRITDELKPTAQLPCFCVLRGKRKAGRKHRGQQRDYVLLKEGLGAAIDVVYRSFDFKLIFNSRSYHQLIALLHVWTWNTVLKHVSLSHPFFSCFFTPLLFFPPSALTPQQSFRPVTWPLSACCPNCFRLMTS